jgi:uncharacterized protein YjbI with pentapeptide repeats
MALACGQAAPAATVNGCPIRPATLCVELDLRAARLRDADLARADFSQSDLSGADLGGANLLSADLDRAKLNRANLARANLEGADLSRAEMYGANLRGARMKGANLHSADLNGATLDGAHLQGANLSGAHLPGAGLNKANLQRADLSGALLSYADLRGADLSGANLRNAVLTGADLTGARLHAASFDSANVKGCIGCPGPLPPESTLGAAKPAPAAAASPPVRGGCWARIYKEPAFKGDSLTLVGPAEVADVATDWGFSWEPQFHSVMIGPAATFTVFDNRDYRDRTATFSGGQKIADLDERMGVFRTIRSMKLTCAK